MNWLTNPPNPQWHSPDAGGARPHPLMPTCVVGDMHSTVTYENVSNSLFPGALGGAEFHSGGQAVRRLSAVADHWHYRVGAPLRGSTVSAQAGGRAHRARPRSLASPEADRAKRGRRARSSEHIARCNTSQSYRSHAPPRAREARTLPVLRALRRTIRNLSRLFNPGAAHCAGGGSNGRMSALGANRTRRAGRNDVNDPEPTYTT